MSSARVDQHETSTAVSAGRPVVIATAGIAAVLTFVLTRDGVLVGPDSASYLATAETFRGAPLRAFDPPADTWLSIRGLFPPLYPTLVAVVGGDGDSLVGVRFAGIALAAIAVGLVTRLVARHAGVAAAVAVAALLMAARGHLLVLFGSAMSDGLHVVLTLTWVTAAVHAIATTDRSRFVLAGSLAGLAAGAAFATRVVGFGPVLLVPLALIVLGSAPLRSRILAAGAALGAGVAPMATWTLALAATGGAGERRLGYHPLADHEWWAAEDLLSAHLPRPALELLAGTPARSIGTAALAAIAVWTVGRVRAAVRSDAPVDERAIALLTLAGWAHVLTLVAARVLADTQIALTGRHTMLVWWVWLPAGAIDLVRRSGLERGPGVASPRPAMRWHPAAVGLVIAASACVAALPAQLRAIERPKSSWHSLDAEMPTDLADVAAAVADDRRIITNREDLVYLQTGVMTRAFPLPEDIFTGRRNVAFEHQLRDVVEEVRSGRAVIVLFDDPRFSIPRDELVRRTGLTERRTASEGAVFW